MSGFLFDTLVWTAALIALVLLVRRPVTRWFGAPVAYALWALPMLRLLLPPIELPAWLAPASPPAEAAPVAEKMVMTIVPGDAAAPIADAAAHAAPGWVETLPGLPWTGAAMAVWLVGAAVFLIMRFGAYFRLRAQLTQHAREVGSAKGPLGTIRLIETPGTDAPLAFGVLDPVVALPVGFMARVDREARDLALAHELEHHRGHDLLINVMVQPLFALHWFNPLGHYGWLALRRDQEAACDARVIAARPAETRALYASVIASFAAGPNVALAAPMACPVLGDKSIIQRLRNLKMTEHPSNSPARKFASRLMLGTALLALPLTASITYAEGIVSDASGAIAAPPAPAAPVAPVLASGMVQDPPEPPLPPEPPEEPAAPGQGQSTIITIDPATGETKTVTRQGTFDVEADEIRVMKVKDKDVIVLRDLNENDDGAVKSRYETVRIVNRGNKMDEAELELVMKEVRADLAEADKDLKEMRIELKALENEAEWSALAKEGHTVVRMECNSSSDEVATTIERKDGSKEVIICQSRVMSHALKGLEQAREAIAGNKEMSAKMRAEILKELDAQIASWKADTR